MSDARYPFYAKGLEAETGGERGSTPAQQIPTLSLGAITDPSGYAPSATLSRAVNAALLLGKPLLVTGEPGAGKTMLAASIAHELGVGAGAPAVPIWKFETKSTSVARDLFYTYNAIGAFQAPADADGRRPPTTDFLTYQALGRAILEAFEPTHPNVAQLWPNATSPDRPERDRHRGPRRSVVLIDEIDKADTDVPNGLLEALGAARFTPDGCSEVRVSGPFPLVVITTNEERVLPDAFLRRCLVLHLHLPTDPDQLKARMIERGAQHFRAAPQTLLSDAADLLVEDRKFSEPPLPGQAEYLDLVRSVTRLMQTDSTQELAKLIDEVARFTLRKHRTP